ncbi:MAG TPA: hypothetical protein VLU96_03485 [Gaiellaceae bacterium]|nr:hypothetical protein [Gaiellaceae bacterium]
MRARFAWLAAAAGLAGAAAYRVLRRKPRPEAEPAADPRAEELRRKLDESRPPVEETEPAGTRVEEPEPDPGVEDRRAAVHERGRATAEEMRGRPGE